jgi:N-acetyl-anhydromuramyl-L-alanine amidase AmpD
MKRIIMHWSAGSHKASDIDRSHYHFIVQGDGSVVAGNMTPEANLNTKDGKYAAHTRNCNTGSIGVAVAAMMGAKERPFTPGPYPITTAQVTALCALCARLAQQYGIPVTRETILSHAEVQPTLKIKQSGKWDITWLPGYAAPQDPVLTGDFLRSHIAANMKGTQHV